MSVDSLGVDLDRFIAEDDGGAVVMLNLLRFAAHGRERYLEYVRACTPALHRLGAVVLYGGDGSTPLMPRDGKPWDAVLLVRYPSRAAFCALLRDPEYQRATPLRDTALQETVLQTTIPWGSTG
jgi:uncharacterized protein (DUF1330 family)